VAQQQRLNTDAVGSLSRHVCETQEILAAAQETMAQSRALIAKAKAVLAKDARQTGGLWPAC
jgi:hypothetical protein